MFTSIVAMFATAAVILGLFTASVVFGIQAIPYVLLAIFAALIWVKRSAPESEDVAEEHLHVNPH